MTDTSEAVETATLTADAVIFAYDDNQAVNVLLIRRRWDPFEGQLALPGGGVDPGEDVEAAARRELREETGLNLLAEFRPSGVYAMPGRDPRGRVVSFAFAVIVPRLLETTAGDDAAVTLWTPLDQALASGVPLAFDHQQIIADAYRVAGPYMY